MSKNCKKTLDNVEKQQKKQSKISKNHKKCRKLVGKTPKITQKYQQTATNLQKS